MESNKANLMNAERVNLYSVLSKINGSKNIVNIGIIKSIIDENHVTVKLYNSDENENPFIITNVRLLHLGTSKYRVIIKPAIGDVVLLLGNRDFISSLEYNHSPKPQEVNAETYTNATVQAILISSEDTDNVITEINIDENGNINTWTNGNLTVTIKDSDEDKVILTATNSGTVDISTSDTITFDGDSYGGLCKTPELVKQLGYLTARVDTIIDALSNSPTGSQDGGAAYKTAITTKLKTIANKEDFSYVESEKVKHGEGN